MDFQVLDELFDNHLVTQVELDLGESFIDGWGDVEKIDEMIFRLIRANLKDKVNYNSLNLNRTNTIKHLLFIVLLVYCRVITSGQPVNNQQGKIEVDRLMDSLWIHLASFINHTDPNWIQQNQHLQDILDNCLYPYWYH